jgi:7-cyano-7-deazaguanine synthase
LWKTLAFGKKKGYRDMKRCVVLLSGGIDSSTTLAYAVREKGYEAYAITYDYGQRHRIEIESAKKIVDLLGVNNHIIFPINLNLISVSALTREDISVPKDRALKEITSGEIPITYVPSRNIIFLSIALSYAESMGIQDIFIGVNVLDYSGYPDCRPEFIKAFERMANIGTKMGVEGKPFRIHTPLINKKKSEIIKLAYRLGLDLSLTVSCYNPDKDGRACGRCDSCLLRKQAFREAGIDDPTVYVV